ncbi:GNAT family N-acetyltransferase [Marinilactibacillus piezotolerans]|uniref:GNAT family N-acetyltransferase n=1 Tax=Marinilactibacillus piezotolerans TaxID=258723 RepID=UPI0009B062F4|nr:GNAT family N-acetyltransferase [Marinilactibacillus piezotolerans]
MIKKVQKGSQLSRRELDEILSIWLESNIEAHPFISLFYWEEQYNAVNEAIEEAELYVYYEKDNVTAFLGLVEGYIAGLFVKRENRAQGIGRQLLNTVKQENSLLTLAVYKKNQAAIGFYINLGFKIVKEQIEKETSETEYVMQWRVD